MSAPRIPPNEAERLAALKSLQLLDTPAERRFDRLTRLAASLMGTPIALISLVDENRQWFKSHYGIDVCETHREYSFCTHALEGTSALVVPDATKDVRFADNPLVVGPPGVRFYMGIPLRGPGRYVVGTLCVIDTKPRQADATDIERLQDLAEVVEEELTREELRVVSARLQQSNQKLASEHQLLEAVLNNVDAGVTACDESGILTVFNRTAREYIGDPVSLGAEEWAQHYQVYDASGERLLGAEELPLYRALQGESVENVELVVRPQNKPARTLIASGSAYGMNDGKHRGAVLVLHDITAQKELERSLKHQATHDTLTGLPNRGALMEILAGAIARAKRSGDALALLFLDLDGFKAINDTYGHQSGDEVLQLFAQRVKGVVRESDTVARLSGDEFVVIVEQLQDAKVDAQRIAKKIIQANAAPLVMAQGLTLKTSIGIALHREQDHAEALLKRADAAMYEAKRNGGDQVYLHAE